jgi:hypothetical protein
VGRTIKEAYHSYLSTLVFETNRFALNSFASRRMTEQLPQSIHCPQSRWKWVSLMDNEKQPRDGADLF